MTNSSDTMHNYHRRLLKRRNEIFNFRSDLVMAVDKKIIYICHVAENILEICPKDIIL